MIQMITDSSVVSQHASLLLSTLQAHAAHWVILHVAISLQIKLLWVILKPPIPSPVTVLLTSALQRVSRMVGTPAPAQATI